MSLVLDGSNGTTGNLANGDLQVNGVNVGKGGGSLSLNTAVGASALQGSNSGTGRNTAIGVNALQANTSGSTNAAMGVNALYSNTTGASNIAIGDTALFSNTTASNNTAVGYQAGYSNSTGQYNTFIGWKAGYSTTSDQNLFLGAYAGANVTSGNYNTFVGRGVSAAGENVTTGSKNTILGGYNGNQGGLDIRTASNYIVLSDGDGNPRAYWDNTAAFTTKSTTTGWSQILGNTATGINTLGLLLTWAASPNNTTGQFINCSDGTNARFIVYANGNTVNQNNSYGAISDVKLKENIVDATPKLEDLCKVKVRQYNFKSDPTHKQIGVVAQELEEVFAGMVEESADIDAEGNDLGTTTKGVKYSVFVPMLIKAVQELKAIVDAQATEITFLKEETAQLKAKVG